MTEAAGEPAGGGVSVSTREDFTIRPRHLVVLILICVLGGFLRFHNIASTSVWCDELFSIHFSSGHNFTMDQVPRNTLNATTPDLLGLAEAEPVSRIWTSLPRDIHPPLYYLMLRGWRIAFGDSPAGIRSLSAVIGTLAIVPAFLAGREVVGTTGALWVALLNAIAADAIYFGQEARMYALALLWTSLAIFQLLHAERNGFSVTRSALLATWCVLAMLTLYLCAPVMVALVIYAALRLRGRSLRRAMLCFLVAAGVYALVWLPFLLRQSLTSPTAGWLIAEHQGHVLLTISRAAGLALEHFGSVLPGSIAFGFVFAGVYLLPLFLVRRRPPVLLPWLAVVLTVLIPAVQDAWRDTNLLLWPRYTVTMLPPMSVLIVAIAWRLRSWKRQLLPAAMTLFCLLALGPLYERQRFDYRGVARVAEEAVRITGGRAVFASTWNGGFCGILLTSADYYWTARPHDVVLIEAVSDLERLPRETVGDRVVLIAGDAPADLTPLIDFEIDPAAPQTWAEGVGSVTPLRRKVVAP